MSIYPQVATNVLLIHELACKESYLFLSEKGSNQLKNGYHFAVGEFTGFSGGQTALLLLPVGECLTEVITDDENVGKP